ncbi:phage tail protein [Pseudomonas sp. QL9]|uniref:phage tail protein n=1 Tax=Pseudomonas sp. QL9 TaxID=3242725 RepID=UPI00352B6808
MAVTYYALLTTIGASKLANASALGTTLKITQLAVGDGGGNLPTPDASRTALVNEVRRAPLNQLSVDPANAAQIIAEQVIPEDVGGWWIREMGLYDDSGALIAYANCAPSYKPQLAEGSGRTQTVRMVLIVSNTASVELKIDPSVVLATREYVDSAIVSAMNKLDQKQSVRTATTANITLSGLQTLDGVALVAGDRVLVKNQTNAPDNGIYVAATGAWKRAGDADESVEVTPGLTVTVEEGTAQADSIWQLTSNGVIVLGTTSLVFQNITTGLAPLASPVFTGNPAAPTPAQFDNDTSVATTAFVQAAGLHFPSGTGIPLATSTSLVTAQSGKWFEVQAAGITVTLPALSTTQSGLTTYTIKAAVGFTLKGSGTESINYGAGAGSNTYSVLAGQNLAVVSNGATSSWFVVADGFGSSLFGASKASTGYQLLPSGLIMQWLSGSSDANGVMTLTLPIQFPNAVLGGVACEQNPGGWNAARTTVWALDQAACTKSTILARVRDIQGTAGPTLSSGIAGRVLVWGY